MSLSIAVDRLYQTGWSPAHGDDVEILHDGRAYPSILAIQRAFTAAGLELSIKHNLIFDCYRAEWGPIDVDPAAGTHPAAPAAAAATGAARDIARGTVVGRTQHEAAVYALAQAREALLARPATELADAA